jgi:hypothetical protein
MLSGIIEMSKSHGVASSWVNVFGSLAKANFSPGIRFSAATAKCNGQQKTDTKLSSV